MTKEEGEGESWEDGKKKKRTRAGRCGGETSDERPSGRVQISPPSVFNFSTIILY